MRFSWSDWLAVVIVVALLTRGVVTYPLVVGPFVCMAGLVILVAVVRERWRRKKEGYYVYSRGGAEDGSVTYNEGGRVLELYFDRIKDTIYVPSDARWNEIMPSWATDRKDEIVSRIKQHVGKRWIGKSWTYEESDTKN